MTIQPTFKVGDLVTGANNWANTGLVCPVTVMTVLEVMEVTENHGCVGHPQHVILNAYDGNEISGLLLEKVKG